MIELAEQPNLSSNAEESFQYLYYFCQQNHALITESVHGWWMFIIDDNNLPVSQRKRECGTRISMFYSKYYGIWVRERNFFKGTWPILLLLRFLMHTCPFPSSSFIAPRTLPPRKQNNIHIVKEHPKMSCHDCSNCPSISMRFKSHTDMETIVRLYKYKHDWKTNALHDINFVLRKLVCALIFTRYQLEFLFWWL